MLKTNKKICSPFTASVNSRRSTGNTSIDLPTDRPAVTKEQFINPVDVLRWFISFVPRVFNFTTCTTFSVCAMDCPSTDEQDSHDYVAQRRLIGNPCSRKPCLNLCAPQFYSSYRSPFKQETLPQTPSCSPSMESYGTGCWISAKEVAYFLVANFCSWTCPVFRARVKEFLNLGIVREFSDVADFLTVYVEEAHPSDGWAFEVSSLYFLFKDAHLSTVGLSTDVSP